MGNGILILITNLFSLFLQTTCMYQFEMINIIKTCKSLIFPDRFTLTYISKALICLTIRHAYVLK